MAVDTRAWARTLFEGSNLEGDESLHLSKAALIEAIGAAEISYVDNWGTLDALVIRSENGSRLQPVSAHVGVQEGLVGDRWSTGKAAPGEQLSMMNLDVAAAIANGQPIALFGDNLFTRMNLSEDVLEVGALLRIGPVTARLSETPHLPCSQFRARFGASSFEMVAKQPRLRGVYLTVVEGGEVALGDPIRRV